MKRLKMLLDPGRKGREAERLEQGLRSRIIGQDEAIRQVVDIYQTFLAGMSTPGRPIGNLLFLGPTGSGKTRTVEALAEILTGDPRAVVKIDCAEFQHSHEIAKLIGSPPGYLGHRETKPMLSQESLEQFQTDDLKLSLVLFDEIEKASDALWNLLLGILDKAVLTLGDNRRVDFSRAVIFMTGNLGASEMNSILRPGLGFTAREAGDAVDARLAGKLSRAGIEAARRKFTPEFLNRIDRVVVFNPLGEAELRRILNLELQSVSERMNAAVGGPGTMSLMVTEAGRDLLLRSGTDARYGARHLKRAVERMLVQPISNLIATRQVRADDLLIVDEEAGALIFQKEARETAEAAQPIQVPAAA
jgi:ATP-dependent Clp protease ATP-binding subunit ClpB